MKKMIKPTLALFFILVNIFCKAQNIVNLNAYNKKSEAKRYMVGKRAQDLEAHGRGLISEYEKAAEENLYRDDHQRKKAA